MRFDSRANLPGAFLDHATLLEHFGIARAGAIVSPGAADADPMQLAHGLLELAVSRGARLFEAEAIDIRRRLAFGRRAVAGRPSNRSAPCDPRNRLCDAEDHSFEHPDGVVELGDRDRAAAGQLSGKAAR